MKKKFFWTKIAGLGALAGLVNGFLGSAGGILIVPGFIFLGMEEKNAHASSLLVIAPISLVSVFVYGSGGYIKWDDVMTLLTAATIGGVAGAFFLNKINKLALEWIFTGIILFTGLRMVW